MTRWQSSLQAINLISHFFIWPNVSATSASKSAQLNAEICPAQCPRHLSIYLAQNLSSLDWDTPPCSAQKFDGLCTYYPGLWCMRRKELLGLKPSAGSQESDLTAVASSCSNMEVDGEEPCSETSLKAFLKTLLGLKLHFNSCNCDSLYWICMSSC